MKFSYSDPPYLGQAAKHYADHPDYGGEVDHEALIARMNDEFPDGWALSLSSPSLKIILPMCPDDVWVMAWVKPFASYKPGVGVAYAWEPVIVRGGRKRDKAKPTIRDWVSANITMMRGTHGAKPDDFCWWLFDMLGVEPGDTFVDLFPGSGAVTRNLETWLRQTTML